jgi:hypothetical protein
MSYKFKVKAWWGWKTYRVTGHRYDDAQGKMVLYFQDGGVRELAGWTKRECRLGTDWVLFVQKEMNKESGTQVQLEVASGSR